MVEAGKILRQSHFFHRFVEVERPGPTEVKPGGTFRHRKTRIIGVVVVNQGALGRHIDPHFVGRRSAVATRSRGGTRRGISARCDPRPADRACFRGCEEKLRRPCRSRARYRPFPQPLQPWRYRSQNHPAALGDARGCTVPVRSPDIDRRLFRLQRRNQRRNNDIGHGIHAARLGFNVDTIGCRWVEYGDS